MIDPHVLRRRLTVIGELARSSANLNYDTALCNLLTIAELINQLLALLPNPTGVEDALKPRSDEDL